MLPSTNYKQVRQGTQEVLFPNIFCQHTLTFPPRELAVTTLTTPSSEVGVDAAVAVAAPELEMFAPESER